MSVQAKIISRLDVVETFSDALATSDNKITFDGASTERTIKGSTAVPATKVAAFTKALSTGAATIDLTALSGANGAAVDASGLKLQAAKFVNPSANDISIVGGASNGYLLFGTAGKLTLKAGQESLHFFNEAAPDVGGSAKTIDLAGTGSQTLKVVLVFG